MLLLLVPLPVLLARFLADRVLLARLATADSAPSTLGARLTGWQGRVDLRRVLLVTSVPELAVREAKRSGAYRVETFKAPPPSRADDGSPGGGDDDAKEGEET
jgi:hypothetical protein